MRKRGASVNDSAINPNLTNLFMKNRQPRFRRRRGFIHKPLPDPIPLKTPIPIHRSRIVGDSFTIDFVCANDDPIRHESTFHYLREKFAALTR